MKNDENGAAMKKGDGCHKKCKTGQQTKSCQKGQKQGSRGSKNQGKKEAKRGHKLGYTRAVQKEEKEW